MKLPLLEYTILYFLGILWLNLLFTYIPDTETVKAFNSLFLSVGASFISATAIIFSIIIFTLQINNERLPHGMFKKISRDTRLLSSFIMAVILSVLITICSLISDTSTIFYVIQISITFILLILCCFIYSYTRALKLINPIYQLEAIVKSTREDLLSWDKAFKKTKNKNNNNDIAKFEYFRQHPYWIDSARQGIVYCNAYSRRLIEQNDYETSERALKSIIDINIEYIEVKGKTFIRREPSSDAMTSNDKLIEDTLEEIRQNIQNALSTNDERFIISNFVTLKELHYIYSNINYINNHGDRFASNLASQYLIDGLENSISHNIPNVLLSGIRLLSDVAKKDILDFESNKIGGITHIITRLACEGMIDKELLPITKCSLDELSTITIQLLFSKEHDTNYINEEMNKHLFTIGKTEITSLHPSYSYSYSYSYFENTYYTKVSDKLIKFVNSLSNEELTNDKKIYTKKIIENIEKWSDSICHENGELFELALTNNSDVAPQLVNFISNISKCLMKLSTLEIVDGKLSSKLEKNALWLISIFTFIKEDENVINLLEMHNFTDTIFELAVCAYSYNLIDITVEIRDILLSCGFRGQKVNDQNRILAKALGSSIYINTLLDKSCDDLIAVIKIELNKHDLTNEIKTTATNDLQNIFNIYPSFNLSIEKSLNSLEDREELMNYINSISELIVNQDRKNKCQI
ncbi:MAG: hypothetical protein GQ570_09830 [Helicobacteraceae bacterium]|nr:hypothetical protein [Helicobacteraceae bacterium]